MPNAETMTDECVIAAVAGGPPRDRLLTALAPQVRAMVRVRLAATPAQEHAVDDVAQHALIAVADGLPGLRQPTLDGLRAFVSTVVSRRVSDFLRSATRPDGRPKASLDSRVRAASTMGPLWSVLPGPDRSPASEAVRAEERRRVLAALSGMKPEQQEVIALAFFDRLPTAQVAERLGVTRPAAAMLLKRSVRMLRRALTGRSALDQDHARGT